VVASVVFLVSARSAAVVLVKVWLATGSIWPAIALHAAYNSVIQNAFRPAVTGGSALLWVGMATGVLVALVLFVAAAPTAGTRWTYRSTPDTLLTPRS
jgi:uncharacterized protein